MMGDKELKRGLVLRGSTSFSPEWTVYDQLEMGCVKNFRPRQQFAARHSAYFAEITEVVGLTELQGDLTERAD